MSLDGTANDVRIILNGEEVVIVETYQVSIGMLTQPAKFQVQLGHSAVVRELMDRFPPGTPFKLQIAGTTQFDGRTDGWSVSGSGSGTSIQLTGRDSLAAVHDAYVKAEKSFKDVSLDDIVRFVLDEVYGAGKYTLAADNSANRKAMSNANANGKAAKKLKAVTDANRKMQAKLGMRWFGDFLKPQLDRAGHFLWSTQGGTFLLAELNTDQDALYSLRHRRDDPGNVIESFSHSNDTAGRFTSCEVWGRRGQGKETRSVIKGKFEDAEMAKLGFTKSMFVSDDKVISIEQCEFLAKRRIAESRRNSWRLSYTVGGHTTKQTGGGGTGDIIWIPDTIVQVDDEELGITGPHYIESVEHNGSPAMTTTLHLMRPGDVLFGEEASGE